MCVSLHAHPKTKSPWCFRMQELSQVVEVSRRNHGLTEAALVAFARPPNPRHLPPSGGYVGVTKQKCPSRMNHEVFYYLNFTFRGSRSKNVQFVIQILRILLTVVSSVTEPASTLYLILKFEIVLP